VWALRGEINEAHNGYLEIYLNLGMIGLCLFIIFLIASYMSVCSRDWGLKEHLTSLALALWTVMVFYMVTEAGFRGGLLSVVFLQVIVSMPLSETTAYEDTGQQQLDYSTPSVVIAHQSL
jgi:O-antigen ligase